MRVEFQQIGPKLGGHAVKMLLCEGVEQLCVCLIVESIFSWAGCRAGIKVVVRQVRWSRIHLAQQRPVAVECRVETGFKHTLRLGRGRLELEYFQWADLRDNSCEEAEKVFPTRG